MSFPPPSFPPARDPDADAFPAVPHGPVMPPAGDASPGDHAPPRRGRATTAIVVLSLLLAGAIGVGVYLVGTTTRWEGRSGEWEAEARDLGEQVAGLQAELDGANAELTAARGQLTTAQERITDLANEKAQLGDQNVASQQYLDYQSRVSEAAGKVAAALGQCTTAQSQLIGYLSNRDSYEPQALDTFSSQVDELCRAATQANDALQNELAR